MLDTKERLIAAARQIFADRGFRAATVRQIAALAGTNLASINYHFKSKEALYLAVLRQSFTQDETEVADERAASPHDRLLDFIERIIGAVAYPDIADRSRLIAWETLAPTGLSEAREIIALEPLLHEALAVVRGIPGDAGRAEDPVIAARWLLGQCVIFRDLRLESDNERRAVAAQILRLALGGLQTPGGLAGREALPALGLDAK